MTTVSRLRLAAVAAVTAVGCTLVAVPPALADEAPDPASEQYRPYLHFSPERNWMNDPNGLVYEDGTWHLFFQHNPQGTRWGNMSWGHATSTDLVHWQEQPLAIPQTFDDSGAAIEDIFSGSVVVDDGNTTGFGTAENPALVAIYTSAYTGAHPTLAGRQAQSLAYSLDHGQSWTKYEGNPVYDRNSANFRDPKVFRYTNPATGESYWVMAAVEATSYQVILSRSDDLKTWTQLSTFGPANATGGIWECPDLFPLAVDGDPANTKWVLVVNLNPGGPNGGSGGQYFVGDFDGTTFTSESTVSADQLPEGTLFAGFDGGGYEGWTVGNEPGNWKNGPWGDAPAAGSLTGQNPVSGFIGGGLVNGFNDGDWPVGTLESPSFTIADDYVNLLVGGGKHPHVDGAQLGNEPPAGRTLFDFELPTGTTLADSGWDVTGDFATEPARNPSTAGGEYFLGQKRINTWEGGPKGDDNVGDLTSPAFTIEPGDDHLSFLLGGGARTDGSLEVQLLIDGRVVRSETGPEAGALNWRSWDVAEFAGREARLRVHDAATGGWGHLTADHFVLGPDAALVRSDETSVNLVVDGQVVRSATGTNSEGLDWTSWNVAEYAGREASVRIVDNNRSGWGHILVDQVMFSDAPAAPRIEGYDWLDWGRDYYATVSFNGAPDGRRVMLGWMNDWDYAQDIPTGSWRSAMALPREVALVSTPDGPRLAQQVVPEFEQLEQAHRGYADGERTIAEGSETLPIAGDRVRIDAVIDPGSADIAGLTVLGDDVSSTRIGYDTTTGRLFVDRRDSGETGFNAGFASIDDVAVPLDDGRIALTVYVDRASVEVFTGDGLATITDQVFPNDGADRIGLFADGGEAAIESITVTPLRAAMWADEPAQTVPGAPAAATAAIAVGADGAVDVSWAAPAEDGDATITGYRVYPAGAADAACSTDGATECRIIGLALGSTHRYEVAAVNAVGEGPRSMPTPWVTLPEVPANDGAVKAPAVGALSSDNGWDTGLQDGAFNVTMDLWWGENASLFRLYENGVLVHTSTLAPASPAAQRVTVPISGLANGVYRYTGELVNSKGATAVRPLTVTVRDANPGKPALSHDNWDGDGRYTVTANLWWGTNASSYVVRENGAVVAEGALVPNTPAAQSVAFQATGRAKGSYAYTVEFRNAAGVTTSAPITVKVAK